MRYPKIAILSAAGLFLTLIGQARAADHFTVTDLGDLGLTFHSISYGINASGQVTGTATLPPPSGFTAFSYVYHTFLWSPTTPNANTGSMTDLSVLPGDGQYSFGLAINTGGAVVGASNFDSSNDYNSQHAFLWAPTTPNGNSGTLTDLNTLNSDPVRTYSQGQSINTSGTVGGYIYAPDLSTFHAFIYGTHGFQDLNSVNTTSGWTLQSAYGINDNNQLTGDGLNPHGQDDAYRADYNPITNTATTTDLGTLGGSNSQAYGITPSGDVVGQSATTGDVALHAFLSDGTDPMIDLGTLSGDTTSAAYAINASGEIVGTSTGPGGNRAFLYKDGTIYDLNSLTTLPAGWTLTDGFGINDSGEIVGDALDAEGNLHAILISPEPTSLALLGVGAAMMLRRRRA